MLPAIPAVFSTRDPRPACREKSPQRIQRSLRHQRGGIVRDEAGLRAANERAIHLFALRLQRSRADTASALRRMLSSWEVPECPCQASFDDALSLFLAERFNASAAMRKSIKRHRDQIEYRKHCGTFKAHRGATKMWILDLRSCAAWGRKDGMRRRRGLTRRFIVSQVEANHKRLSTCDELASYSAFAGRAACLPISPRRLLRRSSFRIMASAISRMDLRRCRLSRCMAL